METLANLTLRDNISNGFSKSITQKAETLGNANKSNANKSNGINTAIDPHKKAQLQEVAKGFEQIFFNMLFKSMRATLNKEQDITNAGYSQEIFEDMLYEKYSEIASDSNFMGLSETLVSQYEAFL